MSIVYTNPSRKRSSSNQRNLKPPALRPVWTENNLKTEIAEKRWRHNDVISRLFYDQWRGYFRNISSGVVSTERYRTYFVRVQSTRLANYDDCLHYSGCVPLDLEIITYGLLTKCEVKMAGYWPSSFFAWLWTETKSNEANIQPSWPSKLGQ